MSTVIAERSPVGVDKQRAEQSPSLEVAAVRAPVPARRIVVDDRRAVAAYRLKTSTPGATLGAKSGATSGTACALTKPTFVHCTCADLLEGLLDTLDPANAILEIRGAIHGEGAIVALDHSALQMARGKGFKLAFDARLLRDYAGFVPLASYVILDMGVLELERAADLARVVRSSTRASAFATQVPSAEAYGRLAGAGVKLFEGLWFAQPPVKPAKTAKLSYASLIKLLNLVMREAEVGEIEDLLKHDPGLAYKLLRHINAVGFGSNIEITSFRHAVMTLGLKKLFRWTALLVASTPANHVAPAAGTLAIVRGRVMELLALETMSPAEADLAFITGMFSMLDTLLDMPMEDALALVDLPTPVTAAILSGEGIFARHLETARACEQVDGGLLEISVDRHNRIVAAHLEALAWADKF
ncbi:EAL domain-containing protein [soil metagenome]